MNGDERATQVGKYLASGEMSADAIRVIAYLIEKTESAGELEYFVSEEIDVER